MNKYINAILAVLSAAGAPENPATPYYDLATKEVIWVES